MFDKVIEVETLKKHCVNIYGMYFATVFYKLDTLKFVYTNQNTKAEILTCLLPMYEYISHT